MHLIVYVCVNFFVFSPFFVEHILKRALDTVTFFWVFLIRLTEDVISGLKSLCKDSLDISKVLCFEKTLLSIQQNKVKLAFRQLYFIPLLAWNDFEDLLDNASYLANVLTLYVCIYSFICSFIH